MSYLGGIKSPADIKKLNIDELEKLSEEIRRYIIEVLSVNGGHLASNLGVVELTLALHFVFNAPEDKIIFDVGHQSYTHKIITGRRDEFKTIRTLGGLSGFPKRGESPYDAFDTGHSSTSISAGLGYARARDLANGSCNVVSVIGDGAIGSGMAFEALNDLGHNKTRMLIVLNDNEMSISKNVGALSDNFAKMRVSRRYLRFKDKFSKFLKRVPLVGKDLYLFAKHTKNAVKRLLVKNLIFEHMGLTYLGPIDGHNLRDMIGILTEAREANDPVLLHVVTQKGRGYGEAEREPERYHGVSASLAAPDDADTFTECAARQLLMMARDNDKICTITAAMAEGTGLAEFSEEFPRRFFDVGISEQHAVTFASGLACGGYRPYVCIYSTFLQRAYDQILHDVCLQNLPVTFLLDRAGLSGRDGETHHGIFDLAYLREMPNLEVYAPASYSELKNILRYTETAARPVAIRYPHGRGVKVEVPAFSRRWTRVISGSGISILAVGSRMLKIARHAAANLQEQGVAVSVYDCCAVKPLDTETLHTIRNEFLVTMEDGVLAGGFCSAVLEHYALLGFKPNIKSFGYREVPTHGSIAELLEKSGITRQAVEECIKAYEA